ncbi:ribosomal maturation YjgA family protein [Streptomyces corynorhini]|uniref:DUF2809 domain-containing protein n=1 Tax=Streptomyces corynorhini TaxID=2282652 RepID=A0A370BCX4_9ACTN|nr:DUF2809 domain-containing protein [Streptomyces corynorhini]RDG37305.1 DUF2809 domain-containing protein [Streptomyces corynorhini]
MGDLARTRFFAALAAVSTVGAGLGIRAVGSGDVAKYGGDALYTVLVYALVVLALPRARPAVAASGALAFSWAVELFQLTGLPAEWAGRGALARLVLGSTFNVPDLLWYAVGAAACWAVHTSLRTTARRTADPAPPADPPRRTVRRTVL